MRIRHKTGAAGSLSRIMKIKAPLRRREKLTVSPTVCPKSLVHVIDILAI